MRNQRNSFTLILMLSSIALLLVFQFFWIRSAYNKAFEDLRKETNLIFRNTIFAMRDSAVQQYTERFRGDSSTHRFSIRRRPWDSLRFSGSSADSMVNHINLHDKTARVQVFGSPSKHGEAHGEDRSRRNYVYRLGPDSLKIDSIGYYFKISLAKAGIGLPFKVIQVKRGERPVVKYSSFVSEPVRINAINRYVVSVSNVQGVLIREIIPQLIFSVFLTLLTIGSFYLLYKNIRTQQRLVELKNDFISNVTHELKTPITTVGVALEALKNFKGLSNPHLTEEYLSIAQNELSRLTALTDKVLKTAIFENNGVAFRSERVDIAKLVEQILASMKPVLEKTDANVTFRKEGTDFILLGSADHLTSVINNLIDNAIKYSSLPAVPIAIGITLRDLGGKIELSVQDDGIGIAQEYQKKIFEKFFRVPTGDVHTVKGYGLGLNYVDSVIRSHHGSIEVKSSPGNGSCFIIIVPKGKL